MSRISRSTVKHWVDSPYFTWVVLSVPALIWLIGYWREYWVYGEFVHHSGRFSVQLLIFIVALPGLRTVLPGARFVRWFLARRRYLGVACFAYALLHTLAYLQRKADLQLIAREAMDHYMLVGWLSFFVMLPLALTSNDWFVRLMRRAWRKLHSLVHVTAVLALLHWLWSAFDPAVAYYHAMVLAVVLLLRLKPTGAHLDSKS